MNTRLIIALTLALALLTPVAISAAASSPKQATVAKKKLSYCQKKGKAAKGTLFSKVKAAKFFLYIQKGKRDYFFCSESPKYTGQIAEWAGIKKTSHLRAVKNNCAIFFSESKQGPGYDDGAKYLKIVSAQYFRKGSKLPKQTSASRLGTKDQTVTLQSLTVAKNCVYAAGYTLNGVSTILMAGTGDFGYTGRIERSIPAASAAELKAIKVTYNSATSSTISWTEAGVPKSFEYVKK